MPNLKEKIVPFEPVSAEDASRLAELEPIIERGMASFVEVGNALREISDRRLYRATHATFKDYCEQKWKISVAHAYRLAEAAETVKSLPANLSPIGEKMNESQARELSKVEPEQRAEVLQAAAKDGEKITAKAIKAEVEKRQPKVMKPVKPAKVIEVEPAEEGFCAAEEERIHPAEPKLPDQALVDDLKALTEKLELALLFPDPEDEPLDLAQSELRKLRQAVSKLLENFFAPRWKV